LPFFVLDLAADQSQKTAARLEQPILPQPEVPGLVHRSLITVH